MIFIVWSSRENLSSPVLRTPSPLVMRGERDRVRGAMVNGLSLLLRPLLLLEFGEERAVQFFLADRGQRPVARTEDHLVGQGEDAGAVRAQCLIVIHEPAAHRAGKERVANHGDSSSQTRYYERRAAAGMTAGAARLDLQAARCKNLPVGERL